MGLGPRLSLGGLAVEGDGVRGLDSWVFGWGL